MKKIRNFKWDEIKMGLFILFWGAVVAVPFYITLNGTLITITCIGDC